jgi:Protein kinase domain
MTMGALVSGTTVAARYIVRDELGSGGMAAVYLAFDARLNMDVALKVLPQQLAADPTFLARFRREGHTLAGLTHPNILRLYDLGEDPAKNLYFLVLEHMRGGTLRDRLSHGPFSLGDAVALLRPIAAALDYAHARSVVHRDLKPSNILFDEDGRVVVGDFGLARLMDPQNGFGTGSTGLTLTLGQIVGTPAYMAPELVEGNPPGPAADRYAIGIIAYELLVGRVPYSAETPQAIMIQVVTRPLPLPRQINPNLPLAVERALLKMLARDPALRYASTSEFVAELANNVPRPASVAKPTALADRVSAPLRVLVPTLILLAVVVVAGAGFGFSRLSQLTAASETPAPGPTETTLAKEPLNPLPGAELVDGEYVVRHAPNDPAAGPRLPVAGAGNDALVAVDARLTSLDSRGEILLRCRSRNEGGPDGSAYEFVVTPRRRAFDFRLRQASGLLPLGGLEGISFTNSIPEIATPEQRIHLQLICVDDTIIASINDQVVGSARDSRLRDGVFEVSAGGQPGVQTEARFMNLTVSAPPRTLPQRPANPTSLPFVTTFARSGGEMHLAKADPQRAEFPGIFTADDLADSTLTVDAQVVAGDERAGINMNCRVNDRSWYQLTVLPVARSFELKRRDNNIDSILVPRSLSDAIPDRHSPLHIELRCIGDALSARISNRTIAVVHDATYRVGKSIVQANGPEGTPVDVRFTRVTAQPETGPNTDAPPATPKAGTVLLSDDFTDPDHGWLARTSFQGPGVTVGYGNGSYQLTRAQDTSVGYVYTSLPGTYGDVTLSIDATVDRGVLELKCRVDESGSWYAWRVTPQDQTSAIVRTRSKPNPETVVLASANRVTAINGPNTSNHLELSCVGDLISAKVNGTVVGSARDATFKSGLILLQSGGVPGPTEALLDNLVLAQQ